MRAGRIARLDRLARGGRRLRHHGWFTTHSRGPFSGNRLVNTEDRTGRTYGTERTYGLKSNPGAQQAPAEHRTLEHPEIMLYQGRQMSIISLPAEADRRPSH